MFRFKMSMKRILKRIEQADDSEISEIIKALICWQNKVYPQYELVVMSLQKDDPEARSIQIDLMSAALKQYIYIRNEKSDN